MCQGLIGQEPIGSSSSGTAACANRPSSSDRHSRESGNPGEMRLMQGPILLLCSGSSTSLTSCGSKVNKLTPDPIAGRAQIAASAGRVPSFTEVPNDLRLGFLTFLHSGAIRLLLAEENSIPLPVANRARCPAPVRNNTPIFVSYHSLCRPYPCNTFPRIGLFLHQGNRHRQL